MAISGQESINIGNPNDPTSSDSLFLAFKKTQNNFTRLFSTSSPITNISGGNGVAVTAVSASSYKIENTGVTELIAGTGVTLSGNTGQITISSTGGGGGGGGGGTVTSVAITSTDGSLSVSGSPIVSAGAINLSLANSGVTAGSYRNANIVVDSKGRVTSISNGSSSGTVTSVAVTAGDGIQVSGSPITSAGTINITNTGVTSIVAGTGVSINQSNGAVTISSVGGGGGGGTVTRVGITSNTLAVSGSPIVSSGNINVEMPSTGNFSIINTPVASITSLSSESVTVSTSSANSLITTTQASNTATTGGWVSKKARGTLSVPVAASTGDELLKIQGQGYTSFGQYQNSGSIRVITAATAGNSTSYIPSNVVITTTGTSNVAHSFILDFTGNLTIPGVYKGSAAGLSNIPAGNISGTVANAAYATSAGTATNATYATSAGTATTATSAGSATTAGTANSALVANSANSIAGGNVSGTVANATFAATAAAVTGANQSNITSLGTLVGLSSGGNVNFTTASNVSLGTNSTVRINGGSNGQVLTTNGSGVLSWTTPSTGGTPGGSNTQVQFNNAGSFGGSANLTFNGTTLSVTGNISASGTFSAGNISTSGTGVTSITSSSDVNLNCAGGSGQVGATGNLRAITGANGGGFAIGKLVTTSSAPAGASATGVAGQIAYANGFIYVCVATNTWQRAALSTF